MRSFTPLHLEILLHHHCSSAPFRDRTETISRYRDALCSLGLLDITNGVYRTTPRGVAHVQQILSLPLPRQTFVDSHGNAIGEDSDD